MLRTVRLFKESLTRSDKNVGGVMISIKKHLDQQTQQREELLGLALEGYKSAVTAMAAGGSRACPSLADGFQRSLAALRERLDPGRHPEEIAATGKQIERELDAWGSRASEYYRQKTAEIREIILSMTEAAQAVGERDQRYRDQFSEVSTRLRTIGSLDDLAKIRQLVNQSASERRTCVDRMVEDGEQSVTRLKAQLVSYEERLAAAESSPLRTASPASPIALVSSAKSRHASAPAAPFVCWWRT